MKILKCHCGLIEAKINLKRGDRLYFYTDGIPEAKGPNGDLFGYTRFKDSIMKYQHEPIGTVIHQLFDVYDLHY